MAEDVIRVVIVDDHVLVREGIRQALSVDGLEVVGEAGSGPEGYEVALATRPDVVLMDISLPGENGMAATARLRASLPEVRVLMLSVHDHAEYVVESARAGAHGYLRKDTLPADLRAAIREVHAGRTAFADFTSGETEAITPAIETNIEQRLALLTRRERETLVGIASGKTNKEIAAELGLSVRTIESYRETLMQKLGIRTVAGLTRFAIDARLTAPPG